MKVTQIYELYHSNEDIKTYIDKFCISNQVPLHEAVLTKVVQGYIEYVLSKGGDSSRTK